MERVEELLEDWYFNHQDEHLMKWLCAEKILKHEDTGILIGYTNCKNIVL